MQTQVTQNTEALKGARTEVNDLRRQIQTLEIELESQKSLVRSTQSAPTSLTSALTTQHSHFSSLTLTVLTQASHPGDCPRPSCRLQLERSSNLLSFPVWRWQKASLEGTLRDTEMRYNMEIEALNNVLLGLEAELTQLRNNIQVQTQEYEALLNTKMKLEAEIATYRRLLDGEDFL